MSPRDQPPVVDELAQALDDHYADVEPASLTTVEEIRAKIGGLPEEHLARQATQVSDATAVQLVLSWMRRRDPRGTLEGLWNALEPDEARDEPEAS